MELNVIVGWFEENLTSDKIFVDGVVDIFGVVETGIEFETELIIEELVAVVVMLLFEFVMG